MPIVTVQRLVTEDSPPVSSAQMQQLADRLGELFGSRPSGTWVKLTDQSLLMYAENGGPLPSRARPTFVEVLKSTLPTPADLAVEAQQIAEIISSILRRPLENTHVLYLPEARGRIAFGGQLHN